MDGNPAAPRDAAVDALRGLAVAAMVLGHLASRIVVPDGSRYVEVAGGIAAPLFLTIVGMMVARAIRVRRPAAYFLRRGALVLAAGVLVDVLVVGIRPFTSMDVLYLIGVAIPAAWLLGTRLPRPAVLPLALAIIFAAPILQDRLGYADYPTEILAGGRLAEAVDVPGVGIVPITHRTGVLNHWIVDGWFPLFPWLGFVLLGVVLGARRWEVAAPRRFGARDALVPGLVLLAAAIASGWLADEWTPSPRNRYGGAFMPPRADYLAAALGAVLLAGWCADRLAARGPARALAVLGRHALLAYVAHGPLVRVAAHVLGRRVPHAAFLGVGAVLLAALLGGAIALERGLGGGRRPATAPPATGSPAAGRRRSEPSARRVLPGRPGARSVHRHRGD